MSVTTIHDILAQFREEELHNRHLGDRFERLICRYLELDPLFADRFSNVWMWNEWPKKGNTGDTGINIVAEERATGDDMGPTGHALFLVPSLSLLSQSLREWTARAEIPLHAFGEVTEKRRQRTDANPRLISRRPPFYDLARMLRITQSQAEKSAILSS